MTDSSQLRQHMVDSQLLARGISDPRVLDAMLRVPRHEFVLETNRSEAYEDHPLPIGNDQAISQPYVVAVILELLQLTPTDIVLEVGTGSGYVTALLAELTAKVLSIERHPALAVSARETLCRMGYTNVQIFTGDGALGLPDYSPYDGILVSATATSLPPALLSQMREGGRMIIPIGSSDSQQLQFIRKYNGEPIISQRDPVRFVPLISDQI